MPVSTWLVPGPVSGCSTSSWGTRPRLESSLPEVKGEPLGAGGKGGWGQLSLQNMGCRAWAPH